MLTGAHTFIVNNSQFIDNSANGPSGINLGIDALFEAAAEAAAYDSGARADAPRCFPGTRQTYIENIIQWAIPAPYESPLPLYWMNGEGGVGKSSIAQTSAEQINESGSLGASFFFSMDGTNKPTTLFPSIAYQLSVKFANYRELLDREILRDKTLVNKTMEAQFHGLIIKPLVELERQGRGIGKRIAIVIDGLDECEGMDARCNIIEIIAKSAREGTTPLCWAFFSRPETHIKSTFSQQNIATLCQKTTLSVSRNAVAGENALLPLPHDVNSDIVLYLRHSFNDLLRRRGSTLKPRWPSDRSLKMIMEAANGFDSYAKTVYRFIAKPDWVTLDDPLRAVLAVITEVNARHSPYSPFAELDALYLFLLRQVTQEIFASVHLLFTYLCLPDHFKGAMAIANLLRLSKADIHAICTQLSPVLKFDKKGSSLDGYLDEEWDIDSPFYKILDVRGYTTCRNTGYDMMERCGGQIEFYDESFKDFLVDPFRSCEFCVKSSAAYGSLFENFQTLQIDYEKTFDFQYSEDSELVLASGVQGSGFSLSWPYGNELGNSFMKLFIYEKASEQGISLADSPELGLGWQKKLARGNFRKALHIEALMCSKSGIARSWINNERCLLKHVHGTRLCMAEWLVPDEFSSLVTTLKKTIKQQQEAEIIQPYSPERRLSSLLFRKKPKDRVERGLYQIGYGSKAIFWFCELNYEKRYYREFRTDNYAEGKKIFRAERFDSWKKD